MLKYNVVEDSNIEFLIKKVNELIQKGQKPLGGICYSTEEFSCGYYQAIIKDDN